MVDSVGTEISDLNIELQEAFYLDVQNCDCQIVRNFMCSLNTCQKKLSKMIANMMFNMGLPTRLSKFKGMKRGVDAQ